MTAFKFDVSFSAIRGLPTEVDGVAISWVKGEIRKSTTAASVVEGAASWEAAWATVSIETTLKRAEDGSGFEDKFLRFSVKQVGKDKQANLGHFMIKVSKYASAPSDIPKKYPVTLNNSKDRAQVTVVVRSTRLVGEDSVETPTENSQEISASEVRPPAAESVAMRSKGNDADALLAQCGKQARENEQLNLKLQLAEQQLAAAHTKILNLEGEIRKAKAWGVKAGDLETQVGRLKEILSGGGSGEGGGDHHFALLNERIRELEIENQRYRAAAAVLESPGNRDTAELQSQLIDSKVLVAQLEGKYSELVNAFRKNNNQLRDAMDDLESLGTERKTLMTRLVDTEEELKHTKRTQSRVLKEMEGLRQAQLQAERDLVIQGGKKLAKPGAAAFSTIVRHDEDDDGEGEGEEAVAEGQDLISYAKFLGLDPNEDEDLLWIAEEGLRAPLPDNFTEHVDKEGNIFYWNKETKTSHWNHPCDEVYQAFAADAKREKERTKAEGRVSYLSKKK